MRVILHYGTAKTGSTALQEALHAHRGALKAHGILYPEGVFTPKAHHDLSALCRPSEEVWPPLRRAFGEDAAAMRRAAEDLLARAARQAERSGCTTVVLSSEMLFHRMSAAGQERLAEALGRMSEDIVPVVYVRSPAPYFLSGLQQQVRASGEGFAPYALQVREPIETVERAFGTRMLVRPFERAQLQDGDILRDFLTHALQAPDLVGATRASEANVSVSAEIMDIAVRYWRANCAGGDVMAGREHILLQERLRALEQQTVGSRRPQLRPEIAAAIVRASQDAIWLRDHHGIRFGDVDYSGIDGTPLDHLGHLTRIEDLCPVDAELRDMLLYRVLNEALEREGRSGGLAPAGLYRRARGRIGSVLRRARRARWRTFSAQG